MNTENSPENARIEAERLRDVWFAENSAAQAALGRVRGLLAAYGEAEGTPSDYEFLVHQIAAAVNGEPVEPEDGVFGDPLIHHLLSIPPTTTDGGA